MNRLRAVFLWATDMSRNNTGNPIGSGDPRDREDNTKNFDQAVNSDNPTWTDRFGNARKTMAGQTLDFNAAQSSRESQFTAAQSSRESQFTAAQSSRESQFTAAQIDRQSRFNAFIAASGYTGTGTGGAIEDYAAGITITEYNQIIRDSSGEFWRLSGSTALPYTTTGAGFPEGGALVSVGDAALRQELGSDTGSELVAYLPSGAGAIQTSVQKKLWQDIHAADFGIIGDNFSDNTSQLLALREYLLDTPGTTVKFKPGHYLYRNPYWLRGVNNCVIDAYGARFENILERSVVPGGSDWVQDRGSIWLNDVPFIIHGATDLINNSGPVYFYGFLFSTATTQQTSITLKNSGDAVNFDAGDRVCIAGYNQFQSVIGFPPNYRYWEVLSVESVVDAVVKFTTPIKHSYNENWRDSGGYGKPRIIRLNRDAPNDYYRYIDNLTIRGATFLPNRNNSSIYPTQTAFMGVRSLRLVDCTFPAKPVSDFCEEIIFENCDIRASDSELGDKMNGTLTFNNCWFTNLTNFAGTDLAIFKRCRFEPGTLSISPNNLVIDDCTFLSPKGTQPGELIGFDATNSQYSFSVSGSTFISEDRSILGSGREYSFSVASLIDTGNLVVTGFPVNVTDRLKAGYAIYTKAGNGPPSGVKIGRVIDIYESGGNSVVKARFNQPPEEGDVFYFKAVQIINIQENNKFISSATQPFPLKYDRPRSSEASRIGNADSNVKRASVNFSGYNYQQFFTLDGILLKLIISVIKPFTGTTPGSIPSVASVQIKFYQNGSQGANVATVRASMGGTRIVDLTQSHNSQSGDTLPAGGTAGRAVSQLQILLVDSNESPLSDIAGDPQNAPHIAIVAEYIPFSI